MPPAACTTPLLSDADVAWSGRGPAEMSWKYFALDVRHRPVEQVSPSLQHSCPLRQVLGCRCRPMDRPGLDVSQLAPDHFRREPHVEEYRRRRRPEPVASRTRPESHPVDRVEDGVLAD